MTQETQAATQIVEEVVTFSLAAPEQAVVGAVAGRETYVQDLLDMPEEEFKLLCYKYEGDSGFQSLVDRISKVIY